MNHRLEVAPTALEAIVLCLSLGTLEAMRCGSWPLEAGIWTLGRPAFCQPLVEAGLDQSVVTLLQSADELSAIEQLRGRTAAEAELDRMIAFVRQRLSVLPDRSWHGHWS